MRDEEAHPMEAKLNKINIMKWSKIDRQKKLLKVISS